MPTITAKPPATIKASPDKGQPILLWQIFIGLICLVAVIACLEFLFALAGLGEQEFLQIDKVVGFSPMPGKSVTWREEGYSRSQFNSLGMRNRERQVQKAPGTIRVAVLGDSMVEGLQVYPNQTFCHLLEEKLNKAYPGHKFEILNFGVSAYNLGQMYLALKHKVLAFQPDIVIVALRVRTTIHLLPNATGGFLFARPSFFVGKDNQLIEDDTIQNAWLKTSEAKRLQRASWLRRNSRLYGIYSQTMARIMLWTTQNKQWLARLNSKQTMSASSTPISDDAQPTKEVISKSTRFFWPIANALIGAMNKECIGHHCQLMLVRLPGAHGFENDTETMLIHQTAQAMQLPLLDLNPAFKLAEQTSKKHLFIAFHFSPAGHQVAADSLFSYLQQTKSLPVK